MNTTPARVGLISIEPSHSNFKENVSECCLELSKRMTFLGHTGSFRPVDGSGIHKYLHEFHLKHEYKCVMANP